MNGSSGPDGDRRERPVRGPDRERGPVENGQSDLNQAPPPDATSPNATAWEDDQMDMDVMESWADDRPVNWNEKIVFSEEDDNGEKRDWAETDDKPDPARKQAQTAPKTAPPTTETAPAGYEQRSYDRRRDYDHRYDNDQHRNRNNEHRPTGQGQGPPRGDNRRGNFNAPHDHHHGHHNNHGHNNQQQQQPQQNQQQRGGYNNETETHNGPNYQQGGNRRNHREQRNSRNYDGNAPDGGPDDKKRADYPQRYPNQRRNVERGFYDDYQRGTLSYI